MKNLRWSMTLAMLALAPLLLGACGNQSTIGVIGGADGPTSIFITASTGGWLASLVLAAVAMLAVVLAVRAKKRKQR